MNQLAIILILAVLVEGIVEHYGGQLLPTTVKPYAAAALAVALCLAYGADLFGLFGLPHVAYVGEILTGLVVGRGSNYLNTLVQRLSAITAPAVPVEKVVD